MTRLRRRSDFLGASGVLLVTRDPPPPPPPAPGQPPIVAGNAIYFLSDNAELMALRGIECRAPDGHAEALHARKVVL